MALTLEEALRRVPQWKGATLKTTPLGGGITNQNYRVDTGDESFVLRIAGEKTELLGINRDYEYAANLAAGNLGIAPRVYYYIQPEGYLVTHFIEASLLPPSEIRQPDNLRKVAELVRKFHSIPSIPGSFSVFHIVEDYAKTARRYNVGLPEKYEWLREQMYTAKTAFDKDPQPLRPCHNDLLNENFLQQEGKIYLLDWEYAGMGDPFFDLANFAAHHKLTDEEERYFLSCYFDQVSEKHWAGLKVMKILSDFREAMWAVVQIGISTLDFDYRGYADKHFERMTQNINDPRWGQWLSKF
jgi:thiamine kinase-like enzyme